jgi:stress-induced morphogen
MDRQEFNRLVFEKLALLNPNSINFLDESEDSLTIEIVSNDFIGLSVLKRINKVFEILSSSIETVDFSVDFVTLTVNEKENGSDDQSNTVYQSNSKNSGYAAQESL